MINCCMQIESLSKNTVKELAVLMLELWPQSSFEEAYNSCQKILHSGKEKAFLCSNASGEYIGFLHVALRMDYVEGTNSAPVGYIEGIYVKALYQQSGIGKSLLAKGELWCRKKGCVEMASDTHLHNEGSQLFHQKAGFIEVNRIICYKKNLK